MTSPAAALIDSDLSAKLCRVNNEYSKVFIFVHTHHLCLDILAISECDLQVMQALERIMIAKQCCSLMPVSKGSLQL